MKRARDTVQEFDTLSDTLFSDTYIIICVYACNVVLLTCGMYRGQKLIYLYLCIGVMA